MTTHYLKIALRNMRRFKLQTIVCLTGLAVGMTCFALGTLWLRFIESFEDFVPEAENVYLLSTSSEPEIRKYVPFSFYYTAEALATERPEIEDYCIVRNYPTTVTDQPNNSRVWREGEEARHEVSISWGDESFFRFFQIEPKQGSVEKLGRQQIALCESAARRIFGTENAVGEWLNMKALVYTYFDGTTFDSLFHVTAIIPDCPQNTQFWYEAVAAHPEQDESYKELSNCCTFLRLNAATPRDSLLGRSFHVKAPHVEYTFYDCILLPLKDLRTDYPFEYIKISTEYVRWFMLIGLLVIACSLINYLITMVSHLRRRGWEFSLRRVLGSSRVHIIYMVCLETAIIFLLAAALAGLLTWLVLPEFREYSGITIAVSAIEQRLAIYLALVILCGMALSASTAWIVMWRTQRNILSSRQALPPSGGLRGAAGTILQMALSMGIIFALVVMLRQVNFLMYSPELGFTHNDLGILYGEYEALRERIRQSPLVLGETLTDMNCIYPANNSMIEVVVAQGEFAPEDILKIKDFVEIYPEMIDSTIFRFYNLSLAAGRLPVPKFGGEPETVMYDNDGDILEIETHPAREVCVNESFCRRFNLTPENAIGQVFTDFPTSRPLHISGVLHNVYVHGPIVQPEPKVYFHSEDEQPEIYSTYGHTLRFRAQPGRLGELLDSIFVWGKDVMFGYQNCEETYNKNIESELMLIKILMAVGGASLFVCTIGTFSLVSLSLQQRRKEIAIRKVHGARMRDILRLFLKGQILSLCIAALLAYPVAYIVMKHWLESYPKQVTIDWWLIPATFLGIAAVVLATITLKIWRAAKESTVEALNS